LIYVTQKMMKSAQMRKASHAVSPWLRKQMLLPLPIAYVREISLQNHLALVGCTQDGGLINSMIKIVRLVYFSYFLWEAGYGEADEELFVESEEIVNAAVGMAERTGNWLFNELERNPIKRIITVHDKQLSAVTGWDFVCAMSKLEDLLRSPGTVSPIQARRDVCVD
jgi:hypothetical protein